MPKLPAPPRISAQVCALSGFRCIFVAHESGAEEATDWHLTLDEALSEARQRWGDLPLYAPETVLYCARVGHRLAGPARVVLGKPRDGYEELECGHRHRAWPTGERLSGRRWCSACREAERGSHA